jgi:glycosyltransferase domain-containing protein
MFADPLSLLTVVIPTFNRRNYVLRQCDVWSHSSAQVLIVDGSNIGLGIDEVENLSKNIRYQHLPGLSYGERMHWALRQVDTPFVASLADDDLFLKSGLRKLIDLLESRPDFSSAIGRTLRFHVSGGEFRGARRYTYDANYPDMSTSDSFSTYCLENINRQYSYYSVNRAETWSQNVRAAFSIEYSSPYVSEMCIQLLSVLRSSSAVVDHLYWLRSDEAEQVSNDSWDRARSFNDWYLDPLFTEEKQHLIEVVNKMSRQESGFLPQPDEFDVSGLLDQHVANNPKVISKQRYLFDKVGRVLSVNAPCWFKSLLKRLAPERLLKNSGVGIRFDDLLFELDQIGVSYDPVELRSMASLVVSSS